MSQNVVVIVKWTPALYKSNADSPDLKKKKKKMKYADNSVCLFSIAA